MSQLFKTIYFSDYPAVSAKKKNLKLAFGQQDLEIYQMVSGLSSQELRELIGHGSYAELKTVAEREFLAINTYCLRVIRSKMNSKVNEPTQLYLPGIVNIDPIHATFRGGHAEPLHLWYPLLEGYSPEFVNTIVDSFAPFAKTILDPFAGTGTTPLTVMRLRKKAFYCEINPLLQYLINVKTKALSMAARQRLKVIEKLRRVAVSLPEALKTIAPDLQLDLNYKKTFGNSMFFDENTYDLILRGRAFVDYIACEDQPTADFMNIAVLSSLVPASLLKRAGDLRYKTDEELQREKVSLEDCVMRQLNRIISDLQTLEQASEYPIFICEDAKQLSSIPPLDLDAVITSPPYLNGTNYFRNTKIELWFLKCLRDTTDLSFFREKAVTAGINDVSSKKNSDYATPEVAKLVETMKESAYDPRIPKMVQAYFHDMGVVVESLQRHLKKNSVVAIDIGDSIYGGIHVPTDKILAEILTEKGFLLNGEILLRKRLSKNGGQLHQVLLIFKKSSSTKVSKQNKKLYHNSKWIAFKRDMPHQSHPFSKRNWGHPLHSLCSYQGKMKPSLAHFLVKTFVPENGSLLDPFAGVGTIPFEAALVGHRAYGLEISPAAHIIASAKLGIPNKIDCLDLIERLEQYIKSNTVSQEEIDAAQLISFNKSIADYYESNTLNEVFLARRYFLQHPPARPSEFLVVAALLHILHGNRPYALSRRSHGITPFSPTGPAEYRAVIPRLKGKVLKSLDVTYPNNFVQGDIYFQDATTWWPREIDNLDAVITSPPFYDSTRFYLANWLRLWFCGWESDDFKFKPLSFIDERQKTGFSVYEPVIRQARERLKKRGVVVFHLGKSRKCNMAVQLLSIASKWFENYDLFSENIKHCESHGIKDKGLVEEHQYLVLY